MNEEKIVNFFTELIEKPEKAGDVQKSIQESMSFFNKLMGFIQDGSPEQQQMVQRALKTVGKKMNETLDKVCEENGVTKEDLERLMQDPNNFDSDIWRTLEDFKEEFDIPQTGLFERLEKGGKTPPPPKKKKNAGKSKKWLSA